MSRTWPRGTPRWSVSVVAMPLPPSSAGLPASSAMVWVGPPLLARVPSFALIGFEEVPTWFPWLPLPMPYICDPSPMRLFVLPYALTRPTTSPSLLPAISELLSVR